MKVPVSSISRDDPKAISTPFGQVLEHTRDPDERFSVARVWIDPSGATIPVAHRQTTKVVEIVNGRVMLVTDDAQRLLDAGMVLTIPPGTNHSFKEHDGSGAEYTVTCCPAFNRETA